MNLLLTGNFDTAERDTWAAALRQALPGHRLCLARGAQLVTKVKQPAVDRS